MAHCAEDTNIFVKNLARCTGNINKIAVYIYTKNIRPKFNNIFNADVFWHEKNLDKLRTCILARPYFGEKNCYGFMSKNRVNHQ